MSDFATPQAAACQASSSLTISQSLLKSKFYPCLVNHFRKLNPYIETNIFKSSHNVNIDALIEHLQTHEQSMRDLNNLISQSLLQAENAMLRNNGRVKKLVLNGDTVSNPSSFDLS